MGERRRRRRRRGRRARAHNLMPPFFDLPCSSELQLELIKLSGDSNAAFDVYPLTF